MKATVTLEQDSETGDLILPLSNEMMEAAGLKIGDTVQWIDNGNGTWSIVKDEKEWVLVETVSQFRMRYVVQVPKGKAEWALDTVTMNEAKEFSQEHIGETIVSHRVVAEDEALDLVEPYLKNWSRKQKIDALFTKIEDLPTK